MNFIALVKALDKVWGQLSELQNNYWQNNIIEFNL
jgi:hypothetical protein